MRCKAVQKFGKWYSPAAAASDVAAAAVEPTSKSNNGPVIIFPEAFNRVWYYGKAGIHQSFTTYVMSSHARDRRPRFGGSGRYGVLCLFWRTVRSSTGQTDRQTDRQTDTAGRRRAAPTMRLAADLKKPESHKNGRDSCLDRRGRMQTRNRSSKNISIRRVAKMYKYADDANIRTTLWMTQCGRCAVTDDSCHRAACRWSNVISNPRIGRPQAD